MCEFDTLFPAVHRFGDAQLGVQRIEGRDHYKVIPNNQDADAMKNYYAHETAHLFGFDESETKAVDDGATRRAAAHLQRTQKADEYLKAYAKGDNIDGADVEKGALDIAETFGIIEVTGVEGLDLEIAHHLREQKPEIAEQVASGRVVQAHYLQALGYVQETDQNVVEAFERLRGAGYIKDTQAALLDLVQILPPRHARRLRQAVTSTLNDIVGISMGTGLRVDDFLEDIGDLLIEVEKTHGSRYSQMVVEDVPLHIGERCAILIIDTNDDNEAVGYQHCLMGLHTTIPIVAKRMNLAIGERKSFGFVSESRFPELYKAMERMLGTDSLLDKPAGFYDIRIETLDGYTMRVHSSLLGNKLLLSKG